VVAHSQAAPHRIRGLGGDGDAGTLNLPSCCRTLSFPTHAWLG
jgi:hypothetical protein